MSVIIEEKSLCCGCSACSQVCPTSSIKMFPDNGGFLYPRVDKKKCVECGLCEKVCPISNSEHISDFSNDCKIYAANSLDQEMRFSSTSGGLFGEIAKEALRKGTIVCGAAYDENQLVEHRMISDVTGLDSLKQSKYIQSDMKNIYRRVKDTLAYGESVLFCGTPCQAAGLAMYLETVHLNSKQMDSLTIIDFICMGVNSPKAYRIWLDEIESQSGKQIRRVWFKYKDEGWHRSPRHTRIDFEDDTSMVISDEENMFMHAFLDLKIMQRPSCGECRYKGLHRVSDITLADFWGLESDDDKGTSMVMINSDRGAAIIDNIKEFISSTEKKYMDVEKGNYHFGHSVKRNHSTDVFLSQMGNVGFAEAVKINDNML